MEGRGTILVEIFVLFRILVQEFIVPELSEIQHFVALLRIRYVYPGSLFLSIPDLTTAPGKIFCPTIFCSHKYHKIVNNLIFEQIKKIFVAKTLANPGSKSHRIPDPRPATLLYRIPFNNNN